MQARWDIFCTVVDNFGDIGVTWRLAKQLAAEYPYRVRLWVDDLQAFAAICKEVDPTLSSQTLNTVEVYRWQSPWQGDVADVVIEAFGCTLPDRLIEQMKQQSVRPLWLNLEYLSAEDWVEGCHGLPSPQGGGLNKVFFFPGFSDKTGGLLREQTLLAKRDAFVANQEAVDGFLQSLGVTPIAGAQRLSLFAYEIPALGEWLEALSESPTPIQLLVPAGRILGDVAAWLGQGALNVFDYGQKGSLHVHIVPFMAQEAYDQLLWCCDFNAVRGEDSFVRAQWAGKPFVWHIYQQEEDAHFVKLDAFLQCFTAGLAEDHARALIGFWQAWNGSQDIGQAWRRLARYEQVSTQHATNWALKQSSYPDLAHALAQFYENSL